MAYLEGGMIMMIERKLGCKIPTWQTVHDVPGYAAQKKQQEDNSPFKAKL
jgi:hypothetical protein